MKKLIIFLLLSFSANAELYVKQIETPLHGKGYIFNYVENSVNYCWVMPEWVDLNYFDLSWLKVTDTAVRYNWPGSDAATECESALVPRVVEMNEGEPVRMRVIVAGARIGLGIVIPPGLPCGDIVSRYYSTSFYWRTVSFAGQTGIALCY